MSSGPGPVASFDPGRYGEIPVADLLQAAARGWIGVDQRLLRSILERGESSAPQVVAFAREPQSEHRINLDPLLIDLFRHYQTPEAIDFFVDTIRREPEDVDDSLIQALLPLREHAIEPLLGLYDELGEEQGTDVAFLLAGLRVHDPRVLAVLLDRLQYDAADGAFCLGLYGDPAARPALEKMLAEIPEEEAELRREISYALEQIDAPEPQYQPEPFDPVDEYAEEESPAFELLTDRERIDLLSSADPHIRTEAAYSFFNADVSAEARAGLLRLAKSDSDANVRGRAWESLADAAGESDELRDAMLSVVTNLSLPMEERGGAAVGLYGVGDRADVRRALEALYEEGGAARAKALEGMWRSLWKPYAKFFAPHLDDTNPAILREALRGAGYFRLSGISDKVARYLSDDDLRDDALFAYAMTMPGETSRGRARGMLRRIAALTHLTNTETRLVMFAIDERLRLQGLDPVFSADSEEEASETRTPEAPAASGKPGRNDPCPCGSGKKYKKCCGQ